jgi:hypothetical protein
MSLTERSISMDADSLDHELAALQQAVTVARKNRWHSGDIIQPEFENFLAALTQPPRRAPATAPHAAPAWRSHKNSWREVIDQTS